MTLNARRLVLALLLDLMMGIIQLEKNVTSAGPPEWSTLIGPELGGYFACSSLVLYGIRERWLPCTERSY